LHGICLWFLAAFKPERMVNLRYRAPDARIPSRFSLTPNSSIPAIFWKIAGIYTSITFDD
jgi:hypothetical protein